MKQNFNIAIEIPEGVEIKVEEGVLNAKGPKGETSRILKMPNVMVEVKENKVMLSADKGTKREKRMIGTLKSHIQNLIQGVLESHVYKLKICSTHFPMTISNNNGEFSVQNFLGEKVPRTIKIKEGVDVKIEGDQITIESVNKELAGQTAGSIEKLCKITNRDRRIFQDGIYIIEKSEKTRK